MSLVVLLLVACGKGSAGEGEAVTPADPEQVAFADDSDFQRMEKPKEGDWLDRFAEPGQTYDQYVKAGAVGRTETRTRFVVQPIGPLDETQRGVVEKAAEFAAFFLGCPVEIAEAVDLPGEPDRQAAWGPQYLTGPLLDGVLPPRLPDDAIGVLGVTAADLYPGEGWNYVFGQASLSQRVGVYSVIRYFPGFWGEPDTAAAQTWALRRTCKVFVHEAGHMLGMLHCTEYQCVMNGSNSLDESDRRPLFLCPWDLHKLEHAIGIDVVARYEALRGFCDANGLSDEVRWLDRRLATVRGDGS